MSTLNVNNTSASFNMKQIDTTLIKNGLDDLIQLENIHDQCPMGKSYYRYQILLWMVYWIINNYYLQPIGIS